MTDRYWPVISFLGKVERPEFDLKADNRVVHWPTRAVREDTSVPRWAEYG